MLEQILLHMLRFHVIFQCMYVSDHSRHNHCSLLRYLRYIELPNKIQHMLLSLLKKSQQASSAYMLVILKTR